MAAAAAGTVQQAVRGALPSSRSGSSYYGQPLSSALLHLAKHKQPPHPLGWDTIDLPLKQHRRGPGRTLYCPDPEQVGPCDCNEVSICM